MGAVGERQALPPNPRTCRKLLILLGVLPKTYCWSPNVTGQVWLL